MTFGLRPSRRPALRARIRLPAVLGAAFALTLATALASAPPVAGHALLESSEPAAGSTLGTSPRQIRLVFAEAPEPRLSSIRVLDATGTDRAAGSLTVASTNPLELDIEVEPLPDGIYTVSWRAVSADDGHTAVGSFLFGVGASPPAGGGTRPPTPTGLATASPLGAVARLLLYVGLIAMFGAGFVAVVVAPGRRRAVAPLALGAAVIAAAGAAGVVAGQWLGAEAAVGAILGTSLGITGLARLGLGVVGVVVAVLAVRGGRGAPGGAGAAGPFALVLGVAALAMALDVLAGHAAAVDPVPLQLAFQWLHVAAAGIWIGGIAALLLAVRDAPPEERAGAARRFSLLAGFAIGVVAVTGALRAVAEIGTLDALLASDYGRIVVLKSGLIVVLALLGATNHFWSVPVAGERFGRMRRVATTEVTVAMVAIALAAVLVDLAPPVSFGAATAAAAQPVVATGNDSGASVRFRLVVTPGAAGENEFAAAVTDYDTKAPIDASAVALRFDLASASGVAPSTLDLQRRSAGSYEATGPNLSIDGIWRITATVTAASGSVEVPLVVATVVPPEPVDVNASPGVPTIYVVHLTDGRTVQVYLDPQTAGQDEVHATFFDAAGSELPVSSVTMAIAPGSGPGQLLAARELEPGHDVADVDLPAGPLAIDVVGPDPATGAPIHVHVAVTVQP